MTPDSHKKRFRTAPQLWKSIMKNIITERYDGKAISYEMIEGAAKELNYSITRNSLRVKFARYKKSGYVRPAINPRSPIRSQGQFWLTESGKVFFGLSERAELKEQKKTAALPTPLSKWGQKALEIQQAAATAR